MAQPEFEQNIVQSTCPYCGVGCGVDITSTNTLPTDLCGTSSHPANFGKLCVKGTNLLQTTGLEGRLLTPQINEKAVSWQQATSHVANEFSRIIAEHGPDSVAFYVSGQLLTEDYYVANKLMKGFIGSANIETNSRLCMSSAVAAHKRAFGSDTVPCNYEDLELTELLVLTGSNAAWTHPVLFQRMMAAKEKNPNLKIVVIDPRNTATAQFADLFLPIKAGSDVTLFNGLLNYLSRQEALDKDFIEAHTEHWQQTAHSVADCDLQAVVKACDVQPELILDFYRMFKQNERCITFFSQGVNQSIQGVDKCNAIINCHLATGKIGKVGSGPFSITGQPNAMGGREVGGLSNMLAAHLNIEEPKHRQWVQSFWQSPTICQKPGLKAIDMFKAIKQGKIKAVWIMATNPLVSLPNRHDVIDALQQCALVVVSDCVEKNDTLEFAHVKLPATTWGEKNGTVTNSERRISRQRSIIPAPGQARHDWQIMCDVAKKMGFEQAFDYNHPSDIFAEHARLSGLNNGENGYPVRDFDISGLQSLTIHQYDQLSPISWPVNQKHPCGRARMFDDNQFFTPSGKAQFVPVIARTNPGQVTNNWPYLLNTGRFRDHWHTMTRTGRSVNLARNNKEPTLAVHPKDAQKLGLEENQLVQIESPNGQILMPCTFDSGLRRGNLFAPIHWNIITSARANVSNCFSSRVDALSGQPDSKYAAVKLTPFATKNHIQIFSQQALTLPLDYWTKVQTENGLEYIGAHSESIEHLVDWCQKLGIEGQWSYFDNGNNQSATVVCIFKDRLRFVAYFHPNRTLISSDWIDSLFTQETLTSNQLGQLLTANVPAEFKNGKTICSCFQIGENQIIDVIQQQGINSVEQLGETLKCGTNCGSCKGDLKQLLSENSSSASKIQNHLLIPTEVQYD